MKHDSVGGLYSVVQAAASPVQGAVWRSFGAVNTDDQGAGGGSCGYRVLCQPEQAGAAGHTLECLSNRKDMSRTC